MPYHDKDITPFTKEAATHMTQASMQIKQATLTHKTFKSDLSLGETSKHNDVEMAQHSSKVLTLEMDNSLNELQMKSKAEWGESKNQSHSTPRLFKANVAKIGIELKKKREAEREQ